MDDISLVVLLKLIRELGTAGRFEIFHYLREMSRTADWSHKSSKPYRTLSAILSHTSDHGFDELLRLGLITVVDNGSSTSEPKYALSPNFPGLQKLLQFSLSDIISAGEKPIKIQSFFGRPQAIRETDIFVAMPFAKELKPIYEDHILKVANELKISCQRGDDLFTTGSIMNDVWSAIYSAQICIVDCTGKNPNVFYELGIAHTLGRKTILITQSSEDIPFDIRHIRYIQYTYTPRGMVEFESRLKKTLREELNLDDR